MANLAILASLVLLSVGIFYRETLTQRTLFDTVSLLLSIALVLVAWRLVIMMSNGMNVLRQYFVLVLIAGGWLLVLDVLAIIWDVPDMIPRLVRLLFFRGLMIVAMVRLARGLRSLSPPTPPA